MYHPQCEFLMGHDTLVDLDAGHSQLTASGAATIPTELNFQILQSLDTPIVGAQPTVDYFFGSADHQPAVQYEQLAPGNHHTTNMLGDYYPMGEPYVLGARSGALVFGAPDDESAAYMAETFQSSSPPRASSGGRKRSRAQSGGFHGGLVNGVEKKEKQRRQRLGEKYTALMLLIPNRTKVTSISSSLGWG
jgi:hypothetical protein